MSVFVFKFRMGKRVRTWKKNQRESTRFSSLKLDKGFHQPWKKKQADAAKRKQIKELENEIKAEAEKQLQLKKERRRINIQRKQANIQKSSIVQPITNSAKLKKLTKKQRQQLVMMTTY